jgi:hypothetical protein
VRGSVFGGLHRLPVNVAALLSPTATQNDAEASDTDSPGNPNASGGAASTVLAPADPAERKSASTTTSASDHTKRPDHLVSTAHCPPPRIERTSLTSTRPHSQSCGSERRLPLRATRGSA